MANPTNCPNLYVCLGIPDVIKTLRAEALHQFISLGLAFQVDRRCAGEYFIEELQVLGSTSSQALVSGSGHHQAPSSVTFGLQVLHQVATIAERRCIQLESLCDIRF